MRNFLILIIFLCFSHSTAFSQSGFMKNVSDSFGKTSGCKSIKKDNYSKPIKFKGSNKLKSQNQ